MKTITISTENSETYSSISNFFIDYYMTEANGEFVKVYLYLVRLLSGRNNISVAEIADHFNLTEKDICRAIKYWVTKEALRLTFDGNGNPTGIVILPLSAPNVELAMSTDAVSLLRSDVMVTPKASRKTEEGARDVQEIETATSMEPSGVERTVPDKHKYTAQEINGFTRDDDWQDIQYQVETLFGKTLSQADTQSLLYIYDTLGFSTDLMEYLIEYCTMMEKKSCRYMEAVAIGWYQDGIRTKIQAKEQYGAMNNIARLVYKELGIKRTSPTSIESEFFKTWTKDYGFNEEIIKEACQRSVLHASNPTIKYVNRILEDWNKQDVKTMDDIKKIDEAFAQSKTNGKTETQKSQGTKKNNFNNFTQTDMSKELAEIEALANKGVN